MDIIIIFEKSFLFIFNLQLNSIFISYKEEISKDYIVISKIFPNENYFDNRVSKVIYAKVLDKVFDIINNIDVYEVKICQEFLM
ncbi:hypothetical protein GCM10008914_11890 [Clostridium tertium]